MVGEPLNIVLAIIHRSGRVLIIKRKQQDKQVPALTWAFPGGKLKEKETREQSLRREIKEEVGIDIEIEKPILVRTYPGTEILQTFYLAKPKDAEATVTSEPEEIADIKWVPASKVSDYFTSDIEPVLLEVLSKIEESDLKPQKIFNN